MNISKCAIVIVFVIIAIVCIGDEKDRNNITSMASGFSEPPADYRPWIWWHWNNQNISREGIKADLKAMKDAGISGVQIFDVGMGGPKGKVEFMSDEWLSCFRLALEEADKLELKVGIHNCPGWSSSGGPWIKPPNSMKRLVSSATKIAGPVKFSGKLAAPPMAHDYYEDIALFAIKYSDGNLMPANIEGSIPGCDFTRLQSNDKNYSFKIPQGSTLSILFTFDQIVVPKTFFIRFSTRCLYFKGRILSSNDGVNYKVIKEINIFNHVDSGTLKSYSIDGEGRFFKIELAPQLTMAFPNLKETGLASLWFSERPTIENPEGKSCGGNTYNFPAATFCSNNTEESPVQIIKLDDNLKEGGLLEWDVPAGTWTLLRIGATSTGKTNGPASSIKSAGLECDKLDPRALETHWSAMMDPLLKAAQGTKSFDNVIIDSYEAGGQNWGTGILEKFKLLCGYDPRPFLLAIFGFPVVSPEASERFLHDWRYVISNMMAENYFGKFTELCTNSGLDSYIEPYEGPFDSMAAGRKATVPMGEFSLGSGDYTCRLAASIAHIYGQKTVMAESFTVPDAAMGGGWREAPYCMKTSGDAQFCMGTNRLALHSYVHQPYMQPEAKPGLTLGQYGMHFGRNQTWWPFAKAWTDYLARCQFMLHQGRFGADVCIFPGECQPNKLVFANDLKRAGYDYDACDRDTLLNLLRVEDGKLTLPSGMEYKILVMKDSGTMSLDVLRKMEKLLRAGAVVWAEKPIRTPGLSGYPESEKTLRKVTDEIWGMNPAAKGNIAVGKGRLFWGYSVPDTLTILGIQQDFAIHDKTSDAVVWLHRLAGEDDLYFISNQSNRPLNFTGVFRITGKIPEFWYPETGTREKVALFRAGPKETLVPLSMPDSGSLFVVFRKPTQYLSHAETLSFQTSSTGSGHLQILSAFYGATDRSKGQDVTPVLNENIRNDTLVMQVINQVLGGDPAPGITKRLFVDYSVDGVKKHAEISEFGKLELRSSVKTNSKTQSDREDKCRLHYDDKGNLLAEFSTAGSAAIKLSSGEKITVASGSIPSPMCLDGSWKIYFPVDSGITASETLPKLGPLSELKDERLRYFAGIAVYEKDFNVPPEMMMSSGVRFLIALGNLGIGGVAQVELNGKLLGTVWTAPFEIDTCNTLKLGTNRLRIKLAVPWANRLIADAAMPNGDINGWLFEGKPRNANKHTWVSSLSLKKDLPLIKDGLIGPVKIFTLESKLVLNNGVMK